MFLSVYFSRNRWPIAVAALFLFFAALFWGAWAWAIWAESRVTSLPLGLKVLRVGVDLGAMPISNGEHDYTDSGFDAIYAKDLAMYFGVEAVLVPLKEMTSEQALRSGLVDVVLRRRAALATERHFQVLPTGYSSGLNVVMRADAGVHSWRDLAGRTVCVSAGNLPAQEQAFRVNARMQLHSSPAQSLVGVRTGACVAAILDSAQQSILIAKKEWLKFSASLPSTHSVPLELLSLPERGELKAPLAAAVSEVGNKRRWEQRRQTWAANVAFEVYVDQIGPDCH